MLKRASLLSVLILWGLIAHTCVAEEAAADKSDKKKTPCCGSADVYPGVPAFACPMYPYMVYQYYTSYYAILYDSECTPLYPITIDAPHNLNNLDCTEPDHDCQAAALFAASLNAPEQAARRLNQFPPIRVINSQSVNKDLVVSGLKGLRKNITPVLNGCKVLYQGKIKFMAGTAKPEMIYAQIRKVEAIPALAKDLSPGIDVEDLPNDFFAVGQQVQEPPEDKRVDYLFIPARSVINVAPVWGTVYRVKVGGMYYQIITARPGGAPGADEDAGSDSAE